MPSSARICDAPIKIKATKNNSFFICNRFMMINFIYFPFPTPTEYGKRCIAESLQRHSNKVPTRCGW